MINILKKTFQTPSVILSRLRRHFVYKVFLSYFLLITGLLILVISVNSYRMAQRELQQGAYSGTNILNQTASYIQYRVQEINGIVNVITYSDTVKLALIDGEHYYSHSVANWNISTSQGIKEIFYGSHTSNNISKIQLYATSGELSFESMQQFQNLPEERQQQWYDRMADASANYVWLPSSFFADLLASSQQFLNQMVFLVFVVLLFCLPIIYMTSRSLTSRIVVLKSQMSDFSRGIITPEKIDNGNDEIGDLTNSFYDMQVQIQKLLKEQYEQGVAIKDLELQVLQSQINPHFLYNTLDMIYWMGIRNETPAEALPG